MSIDIKVGERNRTLSVNRTGLELNRSFIGASVEKGPTAVILRYELSPEGLHKSNESPVVLDGESVYSHLEDNGLDDQIGVSQCRIGDGLDKGDYLTIFGNSIAPEVYS